MENTLNLRIPTLSVAVLTGLTLLACGSGPVESYRRKAAPEPAPGDPTVLLGGTVVPPDRSLHAIALATTGPTPADATAQLRSDLDALEAAASEIANCQVHLYGVRVPSRQSSEWRTSAEAVLDVTLSEATSARDRWDLVAACEAAILPLVTDGREDAGSQRTRKLTFNDGVLVVDDLESYLPQLLAREAQRLSAAAEVTSAPQLHPDDYRCVATGEIRVLASTLSGIRLKAPLQCRVEEPSPPTTED